MPREGQIVGWVVFVAVVAVACLVIFGYANVRHTSASPHKVYNAHPIPYCGGAPCPAVIQTCSGGAPVVKDVEYTLIDETVVAGPNGPVLVCAWESD